MYYLFDVMIFAGKDVMNEPVAEASVGGAVRVR
jgi:hypothetical protein